MDEKKCYIPVVCGGCEGTSNIYSTDEMVCGTWIDGKPIYRKVVTGKLASESGKGFELADVSDLRISVLVTMRGCLTGSDGAKVILPVFYEDATSRPTVFLYGVSDGLIMNKIKYHFDNNLGRYSNSAYYLILEYTKADGNEII